ncbi:24337_t:CDS:2 [Entrophospora sp. SA101]|nr:24337_t:CDS:2 [Entrophospora sp. SA101]
MSSSNTKKTIAGEDSDILEFLNRKLANLSVSPNDDNVDMSETNDGLPVCDTSDLLPRYSQAIIAAVYSKIPSFRLAAITRLRKYLSFQKVDQRVENVLDLDIVPLLIEFLEDHNDNMLQYETAWIITNIAAGSTRQIQVIVSAGVIQHLVDVLTKSNKMEVQSQIIWALGNIAGDRSTFRDIILSTGVLDTFIYLLKNYGRYNYMIVRITVWAAANLCRACSSAYDSWSSVSIYAGALTTLANLFLTGKNTTLRRYACLAISNIAAGTFCQVEAVLKEPSLIDHIVMLLWDSDIRVVKEACWVLSNVTRLHDPGHTNFILQYDILAPLLPILKNLSTPEEFLHKVIELFVNILSVGDMCRSSQTTISQNPYAKQFIDVGIVDALMIVFNNLNDCVEEDLSYFTNINYNSYLQEDVLYLLFYGPLNEKVYLLLEKWFYGHLHGNDNSGSSGATATSSKKVDNVDNSNDDVDAEISNIEEYVKRLSLMEGVDVF